MIVYVESNFPLELARQQEESAAAEHLLQLAEQQQLVLSFPLFSLCEPFSTLTYGGSERARFVEAMQKQLRELGRMQPHRSLAALLKPLGETLLSLQRDEMHDLEHAVKRMLNTGRMINFSLAIFVESCRLSRKLELSPQDAIVFASILTDLRKRRRKEPKCFISRNAKDFDDPAITGALAAFNCRYIAGFRDGLAYAQNCIRTAARK